jgi:hypothetical protein
MRYGRSSSVIVGASALNSIQQPLASDASPYEHAFHSSAASDLQQSAVWIPSRLRPFLRTSSVSWLRTLFGEVYGVVDRMSMIWSRRHIRQVHPRMRVILFSRISTAFSLILEPTRRQKQLTKSASQRIDLGWICQARALTVDG